MYQIKFNPRWREELVATSSNGVLVFEIAMGSLHVYFPDEAKWQSAVPAWARDKWQLYLDACKDWCVESRIPITIVNNTYVYEDKN